MMRACADLSLIKSGLTRHRDLSPKINVKTTSDKLVDSKRARLKKETNDHFYTSSSHRCSSSRVASLFYSRRFSTPSVSNRHFRIADLRENLETNDISSSAGRTVDENPRMLRFGNSLRRVALDKFEDPLRTRFVAGGATCGDEGQLSHSRKTSVRLCNRRQGFSTDSCEPRKTCLYDLHVENNGKIVNFSGWLLPVQYREAIAVSHQHTRTHASLFDVGHMMQTLVTGRNAGEYLESLTTVDLKNLAPGAASLTVFTDENGGILDDLIITKDDDDNYFVVSNAGRRNEDTLLLNNRKDDFQRDGKIVNLEYLDPLERGLVALQGPTAAAVLQPIVDFDLKKLKFMNSRRGKISSIETRISRCGYTGEDGFEISVGGSESRRLVEIILENTDVKMAGLGSRDSLRLEAGLCLYGHDMSPETTPVEAGLTWLVAKRRRAEANFPGARTILEQIKIGIKKKRIGLMFGQGPPARENAPILTPEGERVGHVTSGGPSPTLGRPIAMGYVPPDLAKNGGVVLVEIRGKTYKATVTKMPFIKTNYYTGK